MTKNEIFISLVMAKIKFTTNKQRKFVKNRLLNANKKNGISGIKKELKRHFKEEDLKTILNQIKNEINIEANDRDAAAEQLPANQPKAEVPKQAE